MGLSGCAGNQALFDPGGKTQKEFAACLKTRPAFNVNAEAPSSPVFKTQTTAIADLGRDEKIEPILERTYERVLKKIRTGEEPVGLAKRPVVFDSEAEEWNRIEQSEWGVIQQYFDCYLGPAHPIDEPGRELRIYITTTMIAQWASDSISRMDRENRKQYAVSAITLIDEIMSELTALNASQSAEVSKTYYIASDFIKTRRLQAMLSFVVLGAKAEVRADVSLLRRIIEAIGFGSASNNFAAAGNEIADGLEHYRKTRWYINIFFDMADKTMRGVYPKTSPTPSSGMKPDITRSRFSITEAQSIWKPRLEAACRALGGYADKKDSFKCAEPPSSSGQAASAAVPPKG